MSKEANIGIPTTVIEKATAWLNEQADRLEKRAKEEQEFRALKRLRKQLGLKGERYSLPGDM